MSAMTAVIFDLGNVVVTWDPELLYRKLIPDDAERRLFLTTICTQDWHFNHDAGVSFADNARPLLARYAANPRLGNLIRAWHDRFDEMLEGPVEGTLRIIAALRTSGVKVLALSNWSAEFFPAADKRFGFSRLFHDMVISGYVGVRKPDPRIYQLLVDRTNLDPRSSVFIDDREENLGPAAALGMATLRFTSPDHLAADLQRLGFSL